MDELPIRRGPGRPPNAPKYEPINSTAELDPIGTVPPRPNRKPFGMMEQRLSYPRRPGYRRYWGNEDRPGGIPRMLEAGYDHVKGDDGRNVTKVVGIQANGQPQTAYLMEIPEEWYQEDMAAQQREVDAREAAMRRGELEAQPGDGRYVPAQGISIKHG